MTSGLDATKPAGGTLGASAAMAATDARSRAETARSQAQAKLDAGDGLRLIGKALKVTVVVDPAVLPGLVVPAGSAQTPVAVEAGGRAVKTRLNSKTFRRAIAAIAEHGVDRVAVVVQGRLVGERLEEAGIIAQPKMPRKESTGKI